VGQVHASRVAAAGAIALLLGVLPACASRAGVEPSTTPSTPAVLTITPLGMVYVDAISHDGNSVVGAEPREEGATEPKPLVLMDRATREQVVLCDWADESLGYCSLAEQGGMIPEAPHLLLVMEDDGVAGWFPSGGMYLVDVDSGTRTRIDVDASGEPLTPVWQATDCEEGCDYHEAPRLDMSTDAVSGDGRIAAFCANYDKPKEPILYVKDMVSGELTRTGVRCGVQRFGREDDDDEFSDEGMTAPQVSADGTVVHVQGSYSSGGEFGMVGWQADTLYFPATGESRPLGGNGGMTRDGRTVFLRQGVQAQAPEAEVQPEYAALDVATGTLTPLPWLQPFVSEGAVQHRQLDSFAQASSDGRLVLNSTTVRDVATGAEADIASLLREQGYQPTSENGPLRISGDGATILADVIGPDPLAEASIRVVAITGWDAG
jgi:hypothetical protein